MPAAYVAVIREKTRNAAQLDAYKTMLPAIFQKHPATFPVGCVTLSSRRTVPSWTTK
jgi:hypothetical protein